MVFWYFEDSPAASRHDAFAHHVKHVFHRATVSIKLMHTWNNLDTNIAISCYIHTIKAPSGLAMDLCAEMNMLTMSLAYVHLSPRCIRLLGLVSLDVGLQLAGAPPGLKTLSNLSRCWALLQDTDWASQPGTQECPLAATSVHALNRSQNRMEQQPSKARNTKSALWDKYGHWNAASEVDKHSVATGIQDLVWLVTSDQCCNGINGDQNGDRNG